jgi:hypothetical protein
MAGVRDNYLRLTVPVADVVAKHLPCKGDQLLAQCEEEEAVSALL